MNNKIARCGKNVHSWWSKSLENFVEKLPQSIHRSALSLAKPSLIPALPSLYTTARTLRPVNFTQAVARSKTEEKSNVMHTFHRAYYYDDYIY